MLWVALKRNRVHIGASQRSFTPRHETLTPHPGRGSRHGCPGGLAGVPHARPRTMPNPCQAGVVKSGNSGPSPTHTYPSPYCRKCPPAQIDTALQGRLLISHFILGQLRRAITDTEVRGKPHQLRGPGAVGDGTSGVSLLVIFVLGPQFGGWDCPTTQAASPRLSSVVAYPQKV